MFNPKTFYALNSIRNVDNIQTPQFHSSNKNEEVNKITVSLFLPYTTQEPEKPPILQHVICLYDTTSNADV